MLALGETATRSFGLDGEPTGVEARIFIQSFAPKPNMYIFGAVDFSRAMASIGKYLGYRVTVVDARPVFATKKRIPDADEVVVAWPDEFLATAPVDTSTAVIGADARREVRHPGAPGGARRRRGVHRRDGQPPHARRAHTGSARSRTERRRARAISAPVGLDIGARTPEETAVSIAAEIVALRSGRAGGRLVRGTLPIHVPRS